MKHGHLSIRIRHTEAVSDFKNKKICFVGAISAFKKLDK